jgi:short-subunit dehydrogenase
MPGATETEFFDRAGLSDTKVGQASKDNPADVAEAGFKAMMDGESDLVFGLQNKLETTMANVTSAEKLAERTRKQYEPGSGKER